MWKEIILAGALLLLPYGSATFSLELQPIETQEELTQATAAANIDRAINWDKVGVDPAKPPRVERLPVNELVDLIVVSADQTSCHDDDRSNGFNGQSVSCEFTCEVGSFLSVTAQAGDADAYVSASADCAGEAAHCESHGWCEGVSRDATRSAGRGICSANSKEFWDSGLSVHCTGDGGAMDADELQRIARCVAQHPTRVLQCVDGLEGVLMVAIERGRSQ